MLRRKIAAGLIVAGLVATFAAGAAFAQASQEYFDAQLQKMMTDMAKQEQNKLKADLGVSDAEWSVLQPKIEIVQKLSASDEVAKARKELEETLANKDAPPQDIVAKMKALRAATRKAMKERAKACAELKELLTPRQEVLLVMNGTLE